MQVRNNNFISLLIPFILGLALGLLIQNFPQNKFLGLPAPPPKKTSDGPEMSNRQPQVVDLVKLYPKIVKRQGSSKTANIALTFDDGPDNRYTPKILDILKKHKVKATFFVVGTQIKKYPAIFRRMVKEGHEIGTHGYQHLNVSKLSAAQIHNQLSESNKLIRKLGGPRQTIYRPPYGAICPSVVEQIGKKGYKVILWTIDSLDWRSLKKAQVIKNVVPQLKKGCIVLQHNAAESKRENLTGSIQALPHIITEAKKRGFRFVTVSQLLKSVPQK